MISPFEQHLYLVLILQLFRLFVKKNRLLQAKLHVKNQQDRPRPFLVNCD